MILKFNLDKGADGLEHAATGSQMLDVYLKFNILMINTVSVFLTFENSQGLRYLELTLKDQVYMTTIRQDLI